MSNVVYLHGQPQPISRFLRVKEHLRLEEMLAAGRLPYDRFVVEAGGFQQQRELVNALKQKGYELTLDTNIAELSAIGRFQGMAKNAPWAGSDVVLTESQLKRGANTDIIGAIARFAVNNGFTRVHAPAHYISGVLDPWFDIDLDNCEALRVALDAEGGGLISIDYPLMISNAVLNDSAQRRALCARLASMPAESIWMRVSGFGVGAAGAAVQKYIVGAQDFHVLNKPIVADGVGGIVGLAIVSFGATCGVSYGVATKERFNASAWHKPPNKGGGGGGYCVLLSGFDRLLQRDEAETLINAPGGRRLLSCNDRLCCPHGFDDTLNDPKGHFLRQRARGFDAISAVPELLRSQHFLNKVLAEADRKARQIARLKVGDQNLAKRLADESDRLDRMRAVLENLEKTATAATRPPGFPSAINTNAAAKKDGH